MQKFKSKTYALCFNAVMAALFVVLGMLSVPVANDYKITFAPLPIVIAAMCYGPVSGMTVGLVGAFAEQLLTYGISATTALWVLPAGVRGLFVGLLFYAFDKKLEQKCVLPTVIIPGLVVTALNTVVTYIDSKIYSYTFIAAVPTLLIKTVLSIVTSVIISVVSVPIIKTLKKHLP